MRHQILSRLLLGLLLIACAPLASANLFIYNYKWVPKDPGFVIPLTVEEAPIYSTGGHLSLIGHSPDPIPITYPYQPNNNHDTGPISESPLALLELSFHDFWDGGEDFDLLSFNFTDIYLNTTPVGQFLTGNIRIVDANDSLTYTQMFSDSGLWTIGTLRTVNSGGICDSSDCNGGTGVWVLDSVIDPVPAPNSLYLLGSTLIVLGLMGRYRLYLG